MKQENTDFTDQNSIIVYKLGMLSAEVRILKWAGAIAITANFALYGHLLQQVNSLQEGQVRIIERLTSVENRLDAVENRLDAVENRLDAVENRLYSFEQRIASNTQKIDTHAHL